MPANTMTDEELALHCAALGAGALNAQIAPGTASGFFALAASWTESDKIQRLCAAGMKAAQAQEAWMPVEKKLADMHFAVLALGQ